MLALCESCRALARQLFEPSRPQWLTTHAGNLQAGASNHCLLCWGLIQRMKVSGAEMDRKASNLWVHWTTGSWEDDDAGEKQQSDAGGISVLYAIITISPDPSLSSPPKFACLFSVDADEGSPAATSGAVVGRYTNPRISLDDTTTRIKTWLDGCQSHDDCRRTLSKTRAIDARRSPLPKRCVRVDEAADGTLSLTLEETGGKTGSYISLTHRWNSPQTEQSMTVTANYAARLAGQAFDSLDPLFDDVLLVAARVGIHHVWIDSLCIVQDDGADWREEAVKMADYYQNALFTLAAAIPTASRADGLFISMPPPEDQHLVQLPFHGGGHFYVYPHPNEGSALQRYQRVIRGSELASRGWVYQERMLSRRIAWFTPLGVSLQCICKLSDWEGPVFRPETPGVDLSWLNPARIFRGLKPLGRARTAEDIYADWRGSIRDYSSLSLTKNSDRILALSGVGREYGDWLRASSSNNPPRVRLVAGVWEGDLHQSLMWAPAEVGKPRIDAYPTWSWASYDGPTHWPYETKVRHACAVEQVVPCRSDEAHLLEKAGSGGYGIPGQQAADADDDIISFSALVVRGRLQPVRFGTVFPDADTANTVLIAGGQGSRYSAPADRWLRMAAVAAAPDVVAGWAMFGDAALQRDEAFEAPAPVIVALWVSVVEGLDNGSLGVGHFWSHEAFNVVYIRPSGSVVNGFERVGVGRLFGQDAKQGFAAAQEREVVLV